MKFHFIKFWFVIYQDAVKFKYIVMMKYTIIPTEDDMSCEDSLFTEHHKSILMHYDL